MAIILIILWFAAWFSGWIASYMLLVRMDDDYPYKWDNFKRWKNVLISCCSWGLIVFLVILAIIVIICMWIGGLLTKYAFPLLKRLEPKIKK